MSVGIKEAEFAAIYRKFITMMRHCAQRYVQERSMAEDIAQEAFLKYIEYRKKNEVEKDTAAFLYRTTANLALSRVRQRKRRNQLLEENYAARIDVAESGIEDKVSLNHVLQTVKKEDAMLASLYYIEGMGHEEISRLLSMERRTVGRRLQRFRQSARKILRDKFEKEIER